MTQLPSVALMQPAGTEVLPLGLFDATDGLTVENGKPTVVVC